MMTWAKHWLRSLCSPTTALLMRAAWQPPGRRLGYFAILLLGSALASGKFILIKELTNAGLGGATNFVALWLVLTVMTWLVSEYALYVASLLALKLERGAAIRIVTGTLDRILQQAVVRVTHVDPNQMAHYLRSGLLTMGRTLRFLNTCIAEVLLTACLIGTAFVLQPTLATTSLGAALVALAWTTRHLRLQRTGATQALLGQRQIATTTCRLFEALPQIKVYGAAKHQIDRLNVAIQRQRQGEQAALLGERRAAFEMNVAAAGVGIVLVLLGAWLCARGSCTIGDLTAMLILHQRTFASLKQILAHWSHAEENSEFLKALVLPDAAPPSGQTGRRSLTTAIHSIVLEEVDFAVGNTVLLTDVTCRLERGRMYGVAGASGSGKTMFLHLLGLGAYPRDGVARVNDAPLHDLDVTSVTQRIALATWPPMILEDTLAANLSLARPAATDEELRAVLTQVAFDVDLERLQEVGGLNAGLGRRGVRLSVGQLQRLAIARALLHAPDVLLIDDLLTGLDPDCLGRVLQTLRAYARDHVVVLVTLHPEAQSHCDELFILRGGRLVAQLTPDAANADTALQDALHPKYVAAA